MGAILRIQEFLKCIFVILFFFFLNFLSLRNNIIICGFCYFKHPASIKAPLSWEIML